MESGRKKRIASLNYNYAELEKEQLKESLPEFEVGDLVDVHFRIVEGEKERVQVFNGIIIAQNGTSINASITVRRMVSGEGVERVFPLHSPRVEQIIPKRRGRVHRAKLYYLRDRLGKKATRLREDTRPRRALVTENTKSSKES